MICPVLEVDSDVVWGQARRSAGATLAAVAIVVVGLLAASAGPASADTWFPHPANAQWQYSWSDSYYNPSGTVENVDVERQQGSGFTLAWADKSDTPPTSSTTSFNCPFGADLGVMTFQDTNAGLVNTDWNSCPPPFYMPILCASSSNCANSVASSLYNVIWGNRAPVLSEPLLQGLTWNSTGGAANDVSSTSTYLGQRQVKVPAFPRGVPAAVVRTNILQVGALGDPYGSGIRTTWWVNGVGPVRIVFDHAGGGQSSYYTPPVTTVSLLSTNQQAKAPPPDTDYFPLVVGRGGTYRWTNRKHLPQPEVEQLSVAAAANRSARIQVKSVSGPLKVLGQYLFTIRLDGLTSLSGTASAATLVKFPKLGHGRHFFTPVDMLTYGFNPILPAYPQPGNTWKSGSQADFSVYGVTGSTRVIGIRTVKVPAGRFNALEVQSVLAQKGHRFGSGVRTCWFASGIGLVKLVFDHRDGSRSVVELMKQK